MKTFKKTFCIIYVIEGKKKHFKTSPETIYFALKQSSFSIFLHVSGIYAISLSLKYVLCSYKIECTLFLKPKYLRYFNKLCICL